MPAKPGYCRLNGSIPLFLIAVVASLEARNAISRLEASSSLEPGTIAAAKIETCWISAGIVPTKSTPAREEARLPAGPRSPRLPWPLRARPRSCSSSQFRSAIPSRGKSCTTSRTPTTQVSPPNSRTWRCGRFVRVFPISFLPELTNTRSLSNTFHLKPGDPVQRGGVRHDRSCSTWLSKSSSTFGLWAQWEQRDRGRLMPSVSRHQKR
jgi:hypothetical protein